MPKFFIDTSAVSGDTITITGESAYHLIKVLRVKVYDTLTVSDTCLHDYSCNVAAFTDTAVTLNILSTTKNTTEPPVAVTLYQGLPKGDKMEFIIQKAVELGVTTIVPMQTAFCIAKLDKKSGSNKLTRYNKIAMEAAKQSYRGIIPTVAEVVTFKQAIAQSANSICLLYYEHGGVTTESIITSCNNNISLFIGSEGGFSEDEVSLAQQNNVAICTLGKRILRCETAPIVALTLIMNSLGEL